MDRIAVTITSYVGVYSLGVRGGGRGAQPTSVARHPPVDSYENSLCIYTTKISTCNMLLHYLVKVENPKMLLILTASSTNLTVDMFLRIL